MKFTEHRDSNFLAIKKYQNNEVKINNEIVKSSCFLTQHDLTKNWQCKSIKNLTLELLDKLLATDPEVILLGTGEKQIFPDPKFTAYCATKGVGLEIMSNLAASKTFNVLTTEDRQVTLALIIES